MSAKTAYAAESEPRRIPGGDSASDLIDVRCLRPRNGSQGRATRRIAGPGGLSARSLDVRDVLVGVLGRGVAGTSRHLMVSVERVAFLDARESTNLVYVKAVTAMGYVF